MDDLLSEFLTETAENLDVVDVELVKFEKNPNEKTILDNIFRLVHTIKGTCGFLGLPRLEALAHASETVLGKFRDGALTVTPEAVTLILESIDQIKELLAHLEAVEAEPDGDDLPLIGRLNETAEGKGCAQEEASEEAPSAAEEGDLNVEIPSRDLRPGEVSLEELEAAFQAAEGPEDMEVAAPEPAETAPSAPQSAESASADDGKRNETSIASQSIRVNVDILENLMTMVSELVLTRNQLMQIVRGHEDSEFKVPLQRLSNITAELQDGVMKTRMQPIGNAWQKMPRLIRDISRDLDKKIELVMEGAETELDRQVLELIKDPLTHMVRNSCDHGIESPADRRKAGKPEAGKVTLRAYHEGGHIIIEIDDDGKGLNIDKIKEKALSNDLATQAQLDEMSESQIQKFIFHAGLSTAAKVTNVSGRGVGMDVVRTNIEVIGGSVDLRSTYGAGSTFIIRIPLTLAIISALIVEASDSKFAIPQLNVVELVRTGNGSEANIERVNNTQVMRLRNRLLPLIRLSQMLGLEENKSEDAEAKKDKDTEFVVVALVGAQHFGIIVDNVFDTEEIVVKPAATILRDLSMYSGNTILGDGSVIMIIDPTGLAARIDHDFGDKTDEQESDQKDSFGNDERTSLLLFRAGSEEPKAVPLSLVTRLEEFPVENIEPSNGQNLIQYRDRLLPLIQASAGVSFKEEGRQPVLVFTDQDRSMGLVVDEIVDIVQDKLDVEMSASVQGMLGSAVIQGKTTEVIDVSHYLTLAFDDWFISSSESNFRNGKRRVLLVDDNAFYRNMISPLLSVAGYEVTAVESVEQAWDLMNANGKFDLILSDIEMPVTDGYTFASAVKADETWRDVPIVALSSHSASDSIQKSLDAGFNEFVSKADRSGLVSKIDETLAKCGEAA